MLCTSIGKVAGRFANARCSVIIAKPARAENSPPLFTFTCLVRAASGTQPQVGAKPEGDQTSFSLAGGRFRSASVAGCAVILHIHALASAISVRVRLWMNIGCLRQLVLIRT